MFCYFRILLYIHIFVCELLSYKIIVRNNLVASDVPSFAVQ